MYELWIHQTLLQPAGDGQPAFVHILRENYPQPVIGLFPQPSQSTIPTRSSHRKDAARGGCTRGIAALSTFVEHIGRERWHRKQYTKYCLPRSRLHVPQSGYFSFLFFPSPVLLVIRQHEWQPPRDRFTSDSSKVFSPRADRCTLRRTIHVFEIAQRPREPVNIAG